MTAHTTQQGFTLVELVAVMVLLAAGAAATVALGGQASRYAVSDHASLVATQMAHNALEQVLADRRNPQRGYAWLSDQAPTCTTCSYPLEANVSGTRFTRQLEITGSSSPACGVTGQPISCKQVTVTVWDGAQLLARSSLLLAQ